MSDQYSDTQSQTRDTFGFKWAKRDTYENPAMQAHMTEWLFEKYCGGDSKVLDEWLKGGSKKILDAGCGAGYSGLLFFGDRLNEHEYLGVDISTSVNVARDRFAERGVKGGFLQADLMDIPIDDGSMDIIFSEGVLHHTDNTGEAVATLTKKLKKGGKFLFYVYRKKAPIREFTDDHIRAAIGGLDDEAAWDALMPLTKLGETLGQNDIEIEVEEAIPFLGIESGKHSLQRLFYYTICKAFYREDIGLEEMNHINFDWFRPKNCHRHTKEEVEMFCADAGLNVQMLHEGAAGYTVVANRA